jgi:hypothetical protein
VRLIAFRKKGQKRKGGQWKGLVDLSSDFDAPLPKEISGAFRGKSK